MQFVDHVKSEKGRSLRVLVERGDHVVPNIQVSKDDGPLCTVYPCSLRPELLRKYSLRPELLRKYDCGEG